MKEDSTIKVEVPAALLTAVQKLLAPYARIVRLSQDDYMLLPEKLAKQVDDLYAVSVFEENPDGEWTGLWVDPDKLKEIFGIDDERAEQVFETSKKERDDDYGNKD